MTLFKFDKWLNYGNWYIERSELPHYPAVYVIYLNERLSYIGQTNNLHTRIHSHRISIWKGIINTRWGKVADIYIKIKCPSIYGKEAMIEKRLIYRLKPPLNKSLPKRKKMTDSIL